MSQGYPSRPLRDMAAILYGLAPPEMGAPEMGAQA